MEEEGESGCLGSNNAYSACQGLIVLVKHCDEGLSDSGSQVFLTLNGPKKIYLEPLKLNIPHGSVYCWRPTCRFCCPATFSWVWGAAGIRARLRRPLIRGGETYFMLSEPSSSRLCSIMNPLQTRPEKKSWSHKASCCSLTNSVCSARKTKWNLKSWGLHVFSCVCPWECKSEPYGGSELTENKCVSVVDWLLSCRQSPTVAGIAAPWLAVVELCHCTFDCILNTTH